MQTVAEKPPPRFANCAEKSKDTKSTSRLEDLERHLTVLEEKLSPHCSRPRQTKKSSPCAPKPIANWLPYRRKMAAAQIDQLQKQYVHKRLLEKYGLPRLSLFYM